MRLISSVVENLKGILNRYFLYIFVFLILLHLVVIIFNLMPGEGPDGQGYLEKGARYIKGSDLSGKEIFGERSYWPPLWILIIALIFYLLGENPIFISLFLLTVTCLTAYLIYLLGKRLLGASVGQLGGILFLASFMTFKFVNNHQYELLLAFLVLLTFTILFKSRAKWSDIFLAGISWGFVGLCSPKVLIFSPVFFVLFYQKEQLRKTFQKFITFGIFIFLVILPWTVRNYLSS
ncbi:MAG: glycosyltransferase family 39 protein, partial [Candidatus Zixiibacteriota bacterium]